MNRSKDAIKRIATNKAEQVAERIDRINTLLTIIQNKVAAEKNSSVGDFIRLLQLKNELESEVPREIQVTWVEPED